MTVTQVPPFAKTEFFICRSEDEKTTSRTSSAEEGDEFIRNFFIKFGMRRTLEAFQQEWYELKAKASLPE